MTAMPTNNEIKEALLAAMNNSPSKSITSTQAEQIIKEKNPEAITSLQLTNLEKDILYPFTWKGEMWYSVSQEAALKAVGAEGATQDYHKLKNTPGPFTYASTKTDNFKLSTFPRLVTYLLYTSIVLEILWIFTMLTVTSATTQNDFDGAIPYETLAAILAQLVRGGALILFIIWQVRTHSRLASLQLKSTWRPYWSAISWFIPIASIVLVPVVQSSVLMCSLGKTKEVAAKGEVDGLPFAIYPLFVLGQGMLLAASFAPTAILLMPVSFVGAIVISSALGVAATYIRKVEAAQATAAKRVQERSEDSFSNPV